MMPGNGGLVTNRTQESLEGIRGDQTEFVLEDMHQSREQLHQAQMSNRNDFICAPKIDERSEEQESMSITMQEEALSILTADQTSRRQPLMSQPEVSTQVLSVRDHLTCKDAIDFWHRYFAD